MRICLESWQKNGGAALLNILIIEDERQLADALSELLRRQKYLADVAYDGEEGEGLALTGIYDAIILDIMLPKKNGLDVLRALREKGVATPILLLTAKFEVRDKIKGLDTGADDYLTKPFETGELLARIRAITRRKNEVTGDDIVCGETSLSKSTRELSCGGNSVMLAGREYLIMELLMRDSRRIIPKELFWEKIWGYESEAEYNAIEVYISFVRRKLGFICSDLQIRAVRGIGYMLETAR